MSRSVQNWVEIRPPLLSSGVHPNAIRQQFVPPLAPPRPLVNREMSRPTIPPGQQQSHPMNPPNSPQLPSPGQGVRPQMTRPQHLPPMSPYILPPPNPEFGQQRKQLEQYYPAAFNANHPVQVVQMVKIPVGSRSTWFICPTCHIDTYTKVEYESGRMTHIAAAVLCLLGCVCLACLPYCANDFKDATHTCPECGTCIGIYRR